MEVEGILLEETGREHVRQCFGRVHDSILIGVRYVGEHPEDVRFSNDKRITDIGEGAISFP